MCVLSEAWRDIRPRAQFRKDPKAVRDSLNQVGAANEESGKLSGRPAHECAAFEQRVVKPAFYGLRRALAPWAPELPRLPGRFVSVGRGVAKSAQALDKACAQLAGANYARMSLQEAAEAACYLSYVREATWLTLARFYKEHEWDRWREGEPPSWLMPSWIDIGPGIEALAIGSLDSHAPIVSMLESLAHYEGERARTPSSLRASLRGQAVDSKSKLPALVLALWAVSHGVDDQYRGRIEARMPKKQPPAGDEFDDILDDL